MPLRRLLVLLVGLPLLWSSQAGATVVLRLGLPEMTRVSEVIALGRVARQRAVWDTTSRRIVTRVELQVERLLKGETVPSGLLVFERLGGVVDGVGQKVFGEAAFQDGETVLVFLRRLGADQPGAALASRAPRPLRVTGMAQGKLSVHPDAAGIRRVGLDLSGLTVVGRPQGGEDADQRLLLTPRPSGPRLLDDVVSEIERTLEEVPARVTP